MVAKYVNEAKNMKTKKSKSEDNGNGADILDVELTHTKTTKGTHVFANEEEKISIYIPKSNFEGVKDPEGQTLRMVITVAE